jgi:hypothetical protein
MTKRPSLFGDKSSAPATKPVEAQPEVAAPPAPREVVTAQRYPKASTREGKRVVTAYLDPEAFRQLKRIAADEDAQQQDLLLEGINLVFEKRGLSRIA